MSEYLVKAETLTGIADAIRGKTGGSDSIPVSGMAEQIEGIEAGADTSMENALIERSITDYENGTVAVVNGHVFNNWSALKSISLPSLKTVAIANGFANCTSLETVNFPKLESGSAGNTFRYCSSLKRLVLPRLKNVGISVEGCTALEYVDYGAEVSETEMSGYIGPFGSCSSLATLILRYPKLATLSATSRFTGSGIEAGTGYIYVPAALLEAYKAATNWVTYADQFRAIEDYPEITGGAE